MTHPVLSLLHPAFVVRGNWGSEPAQVHALRRLRDGIEHGFKLYDTSKPPPGAVLFPTTDDLTGFRQRLGTAGRVAIDIETAGDTILCVGVCNARVPELVMLHFVLQHYRPAPCAAEHRRWLLALLADAAITKVFHNGYGFDVPMLEADGYRVAGLDYDTMAMAHAAYVEQPKRLSYVGTTYGGIPEWKSIRDDEEWEGKD